MNTNRLFQGIADNATTFQLINRSQAQMQTLAGEYYANPNHGPVSAGQWFETGEDEYWYFLECLPPLAMTRGAFAMSEFKTGTLTDAFFKIGERFFCMTIQVAGIYSDEQEDAAPAVLEEAHRALIAAISKQVAAHV